MTGVEVITTALAAGAAAGSTDVAKSAISDAYTGLKNLLRRYLTHRIEAREALEADETGPRRRQAILSRDLLDSGAATDEQVLAAARRLLSLTDPEGAWASKYQVSAEQARGVQIGDHNTQNNTFQ